MGNISLNLGSNLEPSFSHDHGYMTLVLQRSVIMSSDIKAPIERTRIPHMELVEHSGNVMGFNSRSERCIHRATRPSQGTVNGGAVSKWPRCRWNAKHNKPTRIPRCSCVIGYWAAFQKESYDKSLSYLLSFNVEFNLRFVARFFLKLGPWLLTRAILSQFLVLFRYAHRTH